MPRFGFSSRHELDSCDIRLQLLFQEVIKHVDCTILEGHRGELAQNKAYFEGTSKLKWPKGKHNSRPSTALDASLYPYTSSATKLRVFGGFVLGVASQMKIGIRWGGDWDGDWDFDEHAFKDLFHFELRAV